MDTKNDPPKKVKNRHPKKGTEAEPKWHPKTDPKRPQGDKTGLGSKISTNAYLKWTQKYAPPKHPKIDSAVPRMKI